MHSPDFLTGCKTKSSVDFLTGCKSKSSAETSHLAARLPLRFLGCKFRVRSRIAPALAPMSYRWSTQGHHTQAPPLWRGEEVGKKPNSVTQRHHTEKPKGTKASQTIAAPVSAAPIHWDPDTHWLSKAIPESIKTHKKPWEIKQSWKLRA